MGRPVPQIEMNAINLSSLCYLGCISLPFSVQITRQSNDRVPLWRLAEAIILGVTSDSFGHVRVQWNLQNRLHRTKSVSLAHVVVVHHPPQKMFRHFLAWPQDLEGNSRDRLIVVASNTSRKEAGLANWARSTARR